MKRKVLLLVVLSLLFCMLSACSSCNEEPHVHDYKMQTSDTMHWLKCDCGDTKDYNVHGGGIATCIEKAKCSTCGVVYGELGEHNYGDWVSNGDNTHSKTCIYDNTHVVTENCSGGTATEEERAICEVCNSEYGVTLNHKHNFNKQEVKDKYLSKQATCTERAEYYYSCLCGEKGSETFESGEPLEHNYGEWVSNGDNTHTKTCSNDNNHKITENCSGGTATCTTKAVCNDCNTSYGQLEPHVFDKEVVEEKYIKSEATCEEKAEYYYSCKCGEKGSETFEFGEPLNHSYGEWVSNGDNTHTKTCSNDNNHKITENCSGGTATCTTKAVCDECKTSYGQLEPHVFDKEVVEEKYIKSEATCEEKAEYYYSCSCGEKGNTTFETGELEEHEYKMQTSETMHWLKCDCGDTKDHTVHNGGTPTCVEKAKCSTCDVVYGELGEHNYGDWVSNGDNTHSKTCIYDNTHVVTENCSGGTATEEERAICEDCNSEYGVTLNHTHNFNKQEVKDKYLSKQATCTERAEYYYSCYCGEKGNTTFETGEPLEHNYGEWVSNGDNTHTKTCSNDNTHKITENCSGGTATCTTKAVCDDCNTSYGQLEPHVFDKEVVAEKYLKSKATCVEKAEYYYSCSCGEKGNTTFETGEPLEHNYGEWVSNGNNTHTKTCSNDNNHKITENCSGGTATCTTKAVCNDCNTSYGKLELHVFNKEVVEEKYLKSKATCTEKAEYYYSCKCGEKGNTTFETGELEEHEYKIQTSETMHWLKCDCGDTKDFNVHSGGTATCEEKAICEVCLSEYGEELGHKYGDWISNGDNTHTKTCSNDNSHKITRDCFGGTATCEEKAICTDCLSEYGEELGHKYGDWVSNGDNTHTKTCIYNNTHKITNNCLGGTATCSMKAVCIDCNTSYGEKEPHPTEETWTVNETHHYKQSTCPCNVKLNYEEHKEDDSGFCTICDMAVKSTVGIIYERSSNGNYAEVVGYNGNSNKISIASTYNGVPVKSIGDKAFYLNYKITKVVIPNSITSIGQAAFCGCGIETIEIPSSIKTIGIAAFGGCSILQSVTFTSNSQLTKIGHGAFYGCALLNEIEIPDSVTTIGALAFYGCDLPIMEVGNLEYVELNNNPYYLLTKGIDKNLSTYTINENTKFIGCAAFYDCVSLNEIAIPSSVISIGDYAFTSCEKLQKVVLGSNSRLKSIGDYAFSDCELLEEAKIPSGVTSIGSYAFDNCKNIQSVTFGENSRLKSIGSASFEGCCLLKEIEIPSSVTSMGDYVFYGCSLLKSITFGENCQLESIGDSAFYGCNSLKEMYIPSSVTSIGGSAFYDCWSLESINIPSGVANIGICAFLGCYSLTSVKIPSSLTTIKYETFFDCTALELVEMSSSVTSIEYDAFRNCKNMQAIIFEENSQLKTVGDRGFYNCSSLKTLEIPSSVTSIGDNAFSGCNSLESITIGENSQLKTIGQSAFNGCKSLKAIEIPSRVTSIGSSAFNGCKSLESIEIPSSVTFIGDRAFNYCSSLRRIKISSGVTAIGSSVFSFCELLQSIEIPSSVTYIGSSVFYNCKNLKSISFGGTKSQWNSLSVGYSGKVICSDGTING